MVEREHLALAAVDTQPERKPLANRNDMDQLFVNDVQSVNWIQVREILRALPRDDHTVDWTDGAEFPWRVWLANTGDFRTVVEHGVRAIELQVLNGEASVLVHNMRQTFKITERGNGAMHIQTDR